MKISRRIGAYIKDRGFNLSEVARKTGLDYQSLYVSLYDEKRDRDLRTEELIPLCIFLNVDPRVFAEDTVVQ
ncbi:MAG: helix-turn-helix transcriptional regulator [Lachnospiraceae bacterium]|nr:helix-turn-helix transcriptional regulator [Lachnospiraceae bacterium]